MKTLLVLGGTGMVGSRIIQTALSDPAWTAVVAPTRQPLPFNEKLENPIVDYAQLDPTARWWCADAAVCALGTTMKTAGSAEAFRRVDHDYVVKAAQLARKAGTPTFVLNSSLGANAGSRTLYLRVKGQTEQDLTQLGFDSLTWVRPSLLDAGERPESRPGETAGLWFARRLAPIIPARYRAVSTADVANVMLAAARDGASGVRVIESEEIQRSR
ncbi:NAD(P)H-binding protein [Hydrocarboniclastica marina]|uniref:NAD-dependent epimerase/dehydratase family protein n=1 Tax=Hydrocarboniclastica marina TaxID=2259620 RepID=A0A4P7XL52_9ALTE|nr:NAD(P)H-binding protein [Hydrocarboniclastica marina]QCF27969.1 NAD-dependent epimerase/dehydratase family protein [Hydrocarboniclastica marina]